MSTKSTQKTEDMLDQTFANFDSQVTGIEEEVTAKKSGGGKSNLMLFIAAGFAAVGAVGYIMFFKSPTQQPIVEQQPIVQNQPVQSGGADPLATPKVDASAPVVPELPKVDAPAPVVPELPKVDAPAPVVPELPKVDAPAPVVPELPKVDAPAPVVPELPKVDAPTPVVPELPKVDAPAPVVPELPKVDAPAPVVPKVEAPAVPKLPININVTSAPRQITEMDAGASMMVAEELKSMLEQQTTDFKNELTDVSTKVGAIESAISEQKGINKNVEERLVKLETAKPVEVKSTKLEAIKFKKNLKATEEVKAEPEKMDEQTQAKPEVSESSVVKSEVKEEKPVVVKKKYSKKKKVSKKTEVKAVENTVSEVDSSVLVDKSANETTILVKSAKEKKSSSSLPDIQLHSIYAERVWVKNVDGSLSTYSVGDTLPTGEKIKEINDDKFEIVTNKRKISQ